MGQLRVSGEGKVQSKPNVANVTASVVWTHKEQSYAIGQRDEIAQRLIEIVKLHGVADKDFQTVGHRVHPSYRYIEKGNRKGETELSGFTATSTIQIKVRNLESVNELLKALADSGATSIQGPEYGFDKPDQLVTQARKKAMADAQARAKFWAIEAGVELGPITDISEGHVSYNAGRAHHRAMALAAPAAGGGGAPIHEGEEEVSASVAVVYELLSKPKPKFRS